MTIQEALQSGKRYKRPFHACWHTLENEYITVKDALADDWEVEDEKFEVTDSQLEKMADDYYSHSAIDLLEFIKRLKHGDYK